MPKYINADEYKKKLRNGLEAINLDSFCSKGERKETDWAIQNS